MIAWTDNHVDVRVDPVALASAVGENPRIAPNALQELEQTIRRSLASHRDPEEAALGWLQSWRGPMFQVAGPRHATADWDGEDGLRRTLERLTDRLVRSSPPSWPPRLRAVA